MSRGLTNCNPGNIRQSKTRYKGERHPSRDSEFKEFESMAYGYRAAWKTLESYWKYFHRTKQYYNVTNIINRWAPPTENDTKAYIRTVLRLTSLGGKENLPQPSRGIDTERLERMIAAMTTMECGIPYKEVDTDSIRQGFELAFPGKKSYARTQPVEEFSGDVEDWLIWDEYRDW